VLFNEREYIDLVSADARIVEGSILLDQSMLTGQSTPRAAEVLIASGREMRKTCMEKTGFKGAQSSDLSGLSQFPQSDPPTIR
jgi:magnesium-transporting ATPase (P-type)